MRRLSQKAVSFHIREEIAQVICYNISEFGVKPLILDGIQTQSDEREIVRKLLG
jgi:hypothetical protein